MTIGEKKKLPVFSKSLSKINKQNVKEENNININNNVNLSNNEYVNNRNLSYEIENKDLFYSLNEIKKRHKDKDKLENERRKSSLDIIKETNDNNISSNSYKKREGRKSHKNTKQSTKIVSNNSRSKRKNINGEITPTKKVKEKNSHFSEKILNNIRPKNMILKNRQILNYKNKFFDEYLNIYKSSNNTSIDDFIISSDLGIGSYAKVKLGTHKITKQKYAIKIYEKNVLKDEEKKNTIKNEIYILKQLNNENDNIMKLYDVIYTNKYLYLILEYIDGISLLEYIQNKRNQRINESTSKKLFYQIVKAIIYCQNKNICHRDIKLENVLIIKDDIIKLIDFGFAIKCNRNEYQDFFCGTIYYMPPEIVNKKKYIPFYSDIWSLGVLLYIMLFGNFPFKANSEEKLFELINNGKLIFPNNINVSDEVKKLLLKIVVIEPSKRLSLEEIINDPWFKI